MKDAAGNTLEVGQTVLTNVAQYLYGLVLCEVIGFTNQKVKLAIVKDDKPCDGTIISIKRTLGREFLKFPEQVCIATKKTEEDEALAKALPLLVELWNAVEAGYLENSLFERKGKALELQQLMIKANAANDRVRSLLNLD